MRKDFQRVFWFLRQQLDRWRRSCFNELSGMGANCVASTSLACIFCCHKCKVEKIRNGFVFLPPPPSYALELDGLEPKGSCRITYKHEALVKSMFFQQAADCARAFTIKTSRGGRIPLVWLRPCGDYSIRSPSIEEQRSTFHSIERPSNEPKAVLLHCHGNATDIGLMMASYLELATRLGVEVVGVEYTGYGAAPGSASIANVVADMEAAYDYVVASGVPAKRVFAYGQSVGTGPALALAVKRLIGGLILHSPMLSGLKVIDPEPDSCCKPSCIFACFDFFQNGRAMSSLACPTLIIHGQRDDVIPSYHGHRLAKAVPQAHSWPGYFPEEASHNDVIAVDPFLFYQKVAAFLRGDRFEDSYRASLGSLLSGASGAGGPEQEEMSVQQFSAPQPVVGPEDGRYLEMRQARLQGSARTIGYPSRAASRKPADLEAV